MPPTRFSRAAGDHLEDHREADLNLIMTITGAIQDRTINDREFEAIRTAAALVIASVVPVAGYLERQDQAFRMIQLISNTGGMTEWVDEQLRGMARDRAIIPLSGYRKNEETPGVAGVSFGESCDSPHRLDVVQ